MWGEEVGGEEEREKGRGSYRRSWSEVQEDTFLGRSSLTLPASLVNPGSISFLKRAQVEQT